MSPLLIPTRSKRCLQNGPCWWALQGLLFWWAWLNWLSCHLDVKVCWFNDNLLQVTFQYQFSSGGRTGTKSKALEILIGYLFGAAVSSSLVAIAKFTIGRLRPHFLDVCQPDFEAIDCGTPSHPIFVTDYVCKGNALFYSEVNSKIFETWQMKATLVIICRKTRTLCCMPSRKLTLALCLVILVLCFKLPHFVSCICKLVLLTSLATSLLLVSISWGEMYFKTTQSFSFFPLKTGIHVKRLRDFLIQFFKMWEILYQPKI